jgi:hypothetical protein
MPSLTRPELQELISAILTIIRDRDGFATKTKLIKLIYLADVESYRDRGEPATSLNWIFYLYGPWTNDYDQLLNEMREAGLIELHETREPGDAIIIDPVRLGDLSKLPLPVSTTVAIRQMAERWADAPTRELLDYVYFETEPMMNAVRGERLDFSSTKPREEVPFYRGVKSGASEGEIKRLRRKLDQLSSESPQPTQVFTPPRYDSTFFQAVNSANLEDE